MLCPRRVKRISFNPKFTSTSSGLPSGTYNSNQLSVTVRGFPFDSSVPTPPQPTSSGLPSDSNQSSATVTGFPFSSSAPAPPQPMYQWWLPSGVYILNQSLVTVRGLPFSSSAPAPSQTTSSGLSSGVYNSNQPSVTVRRLPFSSSVPAPPQPTSSGLPPGVYEYNLPPASGGLPSGSSLSYLSLSTNILTIENKPVASPLESPMKEIDSTSELVSGNNNVMWCWLALYYYLTRCLCCSLTIEVVRASLP